MRSTAIVSLLTAGTLAPAQGPAEEPGTTVRVYVLQDVREGGVNLPWAQSVTSHILAEAGVRIKWQLGEPRRDEPRFSIIIEVSSNAPATLAPRALAYAQVFEGVHIRICLDRVRNTVSGGSPLATFLLAHVMAHEITHILEDIDHHSKTGLMKASWTQREIEQMNVRPLSLAPEDVQLIHAGLLKRVTERIAAPSAGIPVRAKRAAE